MPEIQEIDAGRDLKAKFAAGWTGSAQGTEAAVTADDGDDASAGIQPFTRLTKAAVEALRYRGEDIARSVTKSVVKEVSLRPYATQALCSKISILLHFLHSVAIAEPVASKECAVS